MRTQMKNMSIASAFMIFIALVMMFTSCSKEYYIDGGVHDATYDGNIREFLESRPELFDSLVKIIDLTEHGSLLESPQANITFFAPTNQSIIKTIQTLNRQLYSRAQDTILDVRQVSPEVWNKYLARYIFRDKYLLKDYPQLDTLDILTYPGQGYLSIGGEAVNIGAFYNDVVSTNSAGVQQIVKYAGYRQIIIDYNNPVATSDLQPNNGVVHVLNFFRHSFGFSSYGFATDAINQGIIYP